MRLTSQQVVGCVLACALMLATPGPEAWAGTGRALSRSVFSAVPGVPLIAPPPMALSSVAILPSLPVQTVPGASAVVGSQPSVEKQWAAAGERYDGEGACKTSTADPVIAGGFAGGSSGMPSDLRLRGRGNAKAVFFMAGIHGIMSAKFPKAKPVLDNLMLPGVIPALFFGAVGFASAALNLPTFMVLGGIAGVGVSLLVLPSIHVIFMQPKVGLRDKSLEKTLRKLPAQARQRILKETNGNLGFSKSNDSKLRRAAYKRLSEAKGDVEVVSVLEAAARAEMIPENAAAAVSAIESVGGLEALEALRRLGPSLPEAVQAAARVQETLDQSVAGTALLKRELGLFDRSRLLIEQAAHRGKELEDVGGLPNELRRAALGEKSKALDDAVVAGDQDAAALVLRQLENLLRESARP